MYHATIEPIIRAPGLGTAENRPLEHLVDRAYLVTDLVDSTRSVTAFDELTFLYGYPACVKSMCTAVHRSDGELVKTLGDGLEACFIHPSDALDCAFALIRIPLVYLGCAEKGARIALTYGRIMRYEIEGRADYFGGAVTLASRMAQYGNVSSLLMSEGFLNAPGIATKLRGLVVRTRNVKFKGLVTLETVHRHRPTTPGSMTEPKLRDAAFLSTSSASAHSHG